MKIWKDCSTNFCFPEPVDIAEVIGYNIEIVKAGIKLIQAFYDQFMCREEMDFMGEKNLLTYQGLQELEAELQDLKVIRRKEVAQKIKDARELGDLTENAEYDAAKDEQRDLEARIEEIEKILKNVEVVVEEDVDLASISVGCKVRIMDCSNDKELEYAIVGSTEANSLKGKISNESPVGKALLGAKVGDTVTVNTPAGEFKYMVLEIQRSN